MTVAASSATSASIFSVAPRWWHALLVSAGVWFLACVLYGAPAALLDIVMRRFVPQLQLQNVSGSLWNGAAAQAFWVQGEPGQANAQVYALGSVEWHIQPWSLLWLHPAARIATHYGEQFVDAQVRVSPLGRLTLKQTSAALPAALLSNWVPVTARGLLALKLDRAEVARGQWRALQGTLYWQQAQWQWDTRWLGLGDYRCDLSVPKVPQVRCALQGQGALALDGTVDIDAGARTWAVQLQATPAPSLPENFRQSLQVMLAAQPDAQGKFAVTRNGRW